MKKRILAVGLFCYLPSIFAMHVDGINFEADNPREPLSSRRAIGVRREGERDHEELDHSSGYESGNTSRSSSPTTKGSRPSSRPVSPSVSLIEQPRVADPETQKDVQGIQRIAQQRSRFFNWFFRRRKQASQGPVLTTEAFKKFIQKKVAPISYFIENPNLLGLRFLDPSFNKKLNGLKNKYQSLDADLNKLLQKNTLSLKERNRMLQLITALERIKKEVYRAVQKVTQSFLGKKGKIKLAKLASDSKIVDAVIKSGNKNAMERLLASGAKITKVQVEQTLQNRKYALFRLFEEEGVEVDNLDPKLIADLFRKSVAQADVDGVMIAYKLTLESSKERVISDSLQQLKELIKVRSENLEKFSKQPQASSEQLEAMKQYLERLQGIEYFLLDKQVRIDAVHVVEGTGQGFDFDTVEDEESRESLKGVYTDFLESFLRLPTTTSVARLRIRKALGIIDPAEDGRDYAQLVREAKEGPINFDDLPSFLQNMSDEQLKSFEDAYRQNLEESLENASGRTKEIIKFALDLPSLSLR